MVIKDNLSISRGARERRRIFIRAIFLSLSIFTIITYHKTVDSDIETGNDVRIFTPKVSDSYGKIFREIIKGIDSRLSGTEQTVYDINRNDYPTELFETDPIVLSGKLNNRVKSTTQKSASQLGDYIYSKNRFVAGAVELPIDTSNIYGVTLFYDPILYISTAKEIFNTVNEIVFFQNPERRAIKQDHFLSANFPDVSTKIRLRNAASSKQALTVLAEEFAAYEVGTIYVFVRGFIEQSPKVIGDFVFRETWRKKIPSISNRIEYVKKGLVVGFAPDFYQMGVQIGELREAAAVEDYENPRIVYLDDKKRAINLATVKRLGQLLKNIDTGHFEYVFKD